MGDQVGVQSVCEPPLVVVRDISAVLLFSKQCEKVGLFPLPSSSPPHLPSLCSQHWQVQGEGGTSPLRGSVPGVREKVHRKGRVWSMLAQTGTGGEGEPGMEEGKEKGTQ